MSSGASDPLTEHLIRTTATAAPPQRTARTVAPVEHGVSAPPVRDAGTRVRAGNAMNRTRVALLSGARIAASRYGTHLTMAQIATSAGVAKATLYNHLRTREDVLTALAVNEVAAIADRVAGLPLAEALETAALAVCEHPVVRHLAECEPAVIASLARIDTGRAGWSCADSAVRQALGAASADGVELVLRWLAGFLTTPAPRARIHGQAYLVARAVTAAA